MTDFSVWLLCVAGVLCMLWRAAGGLLGGVHAPLSSRACRHEDGVRMLLLLSRGGLNDLDENQLLSMAKAVLIDEAKTQSPVGRLFGLDGRVLAEGAWAETPSSLELNGVSLQVSVDGTGVMTMLRVAALGDDFDAQAAEAKEQHAYEISCVQKEVKALEFDCNTMLTALQSAEEVDMQDFAFKQAALGLQKKRLQNLQSLAKLQVPYNETTAQFQLRISPRQVIMPNAVVQCPFVWQPAHGVSYQEVQTRRSRDANL
jgi:hypothetical protein